MGSWAPFSGLLLDLYELTMGQSYFENGRAEQMATFSVACRTLPPRWGYLVAAGLEDVLADLEAFAFSESDLAFLETTGRLSPAYLDHLRGVRFTGTVRALPEGTVFFAHEPLLELKAPLLEAQLVESVVLNRLHFQSLVASKAARCVDAADGRTLFDLSVRRAPGADAGVRVARASWIAGFDGTSNVLAGRRCDIPIVGTMAHSFIQSFQDELSAFRAFSESFPGAVLLIDTFETLTGARKAIEAAGLSLGGVRIDSGDTVAISHELRHILDEAGCNSAVILVSGGMDEYKIADVLSSGAAVDGFGVGTKVAMPADTPYLDMAYKLVELEGRPTFKILDGKATLPGSKQVWRVLEDDRFDHDVLELADYPAAGTPLLVEAMLDARSSEVTVLASARDRAARERACLPSECRAVEAKPGEPRIGPSLAGLQRAVEQSRAVPTRVEAETEDVASGRRIRG